MAEKICFLAPDLVGIATYTIGLLKNMPKDIAFHVLTTRRELPGVDQEAEVSLLLREIGANVKIYPVCRSTNTLFDHAKFQVACLKTIPELQRRIGFDLLHVNFPLMSELLLTITKRLRLPILSTIHTTIEGQHKGVKTGQTGISQLGQTDLANLFLNIPLRLAEQTCLSNYSRLIATSHFIKKELISCFPFIVKKDISVVHNGVDTEFFHSTTDFGNGPIAKLKETNRPIVLFTGRFVASKDLPTLVRAIPQVVKEHPDVLFVFVGGGESLYYFQPLSHEIRQENCRFLGYLPRGDMPKVYSLASVYVLPTLYESFPLRLLESMACENAVVATGVCGIPEVVQSGENGFLIPPENCVSLAETVNTLLEDPNLSRRVGEKARKTVINGFSAKILAKKTLNVYKEFGND